MFLSILIPLILSAEAKIPNITLSPDLIHSAKEISSPITEVLVFSDRAQIHRKASQYLSKGIHTIRLSNLPNTVNRDSIRVHSDQAEIIRIQPQIVEGAEYSLDELQKIVEELEELQTELTLLQQERSLFEQELQALQSVYPQTLLAESVRKAPLSYNSSSWLNSVEFLEKRQLSTNQKIEDLQAEYRKKEEQWTTLNKKAEPFLSGQYSQQTLELIVVLENRKESTVHLDLEYFIHGASWYPTYDVHYDSSTDQVRIDSAAYVQQSTGEDWSNARISLSTSTPHQDLELPTLLTWTLGEANEYIPHPRVARRSPTSPLYPPPIRQQTLLEIEENTTRAAFNEQRQYLVTLNNSVFNIVSQHSSSAGSLGGVIGAKGIQTGIGGLGQKGTQSRAYGSASGALAVPSAPTRVEEDMAFADYSYDDIAEVAVAEESISRLQGMTSMAKAKKSLSRSDYRKEGSVALSNLNLAIEAPNAYRSNYYPNINLPSALAKGMEYRWDAMGYFSIPANGSAIRIPLHSKQHSARSFYESNPALDEMAYLKGSVENTEDQAILQGSANVFLNKRFSVQTQLQTTLPTGQLNLPLGADENIRIKRNITPQQRKEGLLNQNETTDYTVEIDIGNYKDSSIQIRVYDLIPKSNNTDITIDSVESSHNFNQEENTNGIVYWDLNIPAGKTEVITLKYSITRPKNWTLWGN